MRVKMSIWYVLVGTATGGIVSGIWATADRLSLMRSSVRELLSYSPPEVEAALLEVDSTTSSMRIWLTWAGISLLLLVFSLVKIHRNWEKGTK